MEECDGPNTTQIEDGFKKVQDHICAFLEEQSGQRYNEDLWQYQKGSGGGRTRVWEAEEGDEEVLLEKGGVNFSGIVGQSMPQSAATQFKIPPDTPFHATGVSLVLHPRTPHVPTIHFNIRYFECGPRWWFGGGVDVTPYYVNKELVIEFHKSLKRICEKWGQDYAAHKKHCDEYFYLPHRKEARGVGGLFFDHLNCEQPATTSGSDEATEGDDRPSKQQLFEFVVDLGMNFTELYAPFIQAGRQQVVTHQQRQFQLYRRSRYVEFNLLYDRGTKFGLQSEGRVESILMSMPPLVRFPYNWQPEPGSPEHNLIHDILCPKDWAHL
ncbi:Oxygen-dependent coproporphyrinogen-III oxidase [Balamuthia mandrillaris]